MKQYFQLQHKTKRQEYWAVLLLSILGTIVGLVALEESGLGALIALVVLIGTLWCLIATTIRRLDDAGLHRLWIILVLVPYIGSIATLAFGFIPSAETQDDVE
jgi:uncharacterized membrane protein YhaH (DUF805 family)